MNIERFLEFEGKKISILLNDGQWWIAIKPICEVLGVNYDRQQKNLKEHFKLSQLCAIQHTVAADGKIRKMLCLPEKFIYGWLFSINSDNPQLQQYQSICYEVLYDYFHASMTDRMNKLTKKLSIHQRLISLQEKMMQSDEFKEINDLKKQAKTIDKHLKELDKDLLTGQISFKFTEEESKM